MMCLLVSDTSALSGWALSKTAPEPKNGSTHRPLPFHLMFSITNGASFVLMPWDLIGGALDLIVFGKIFIFFSVSDGCVFRCTTRISLKLKREHFNAVIHAADMFAF